MIETEPQYFIKFREHIDKKFDNIDKKFVELQQDVEDIAIMTAKNTSEISKIKENMVTKEDIKDMVVKSDIEYMVTTEDIKDMATKEDLKPITQLIGSYEIRAKNIDQILIQDHKPRIAALEKKAFF